MSVLRPSVRLFMCSSISHPSERLHCIRISAYVSSHIIILVSSHQILSDSLSAEALNTNIHDFSAHLTLLARALCMTFLSVRPSVCLSNACTATKGNNHLSVYQHHTINGSSIFLRVKFRGPEFRGSRTSVLKTGTPLSKAQIWPIICNNLETVRDKM